jgi:hypothetical protein
MQTSSEISLFVHVVYSVQLAYYAPMLILFRNVLVLLLVLLQLFAPLVHAHVDKHFSTAGLHLPGLEIHAFAKNDAPVVQALPCVYSNNNLIVSIDTGIKDKHLKKVSTDNTDAYIYPPTLLLQRLALVTEIFYSPERNLRVHSFYTPPYAPRAPPLL